MTEDDIRRILTETVPAIDWTKVGAEDDLSEAGLDSLDKASAIMEVEQVAGLKIDDSRYDEINTISQLVAAAKG